MASTDFPFPVPWRLRDFLRGAVLNPNSIGMSGAWVYECTAHEKKYYLKVEGPEGELRREYAIVKWLAGRIPVPDIKFWEDEGGFCYLVTSRLEGEMLCAHGGRETPGKTGAKLLAEGIKTLWSVDISGCPFDARLDVKLEKALRNIEKGLVDVDEFKSSGDSPFKEPMELHKFLCRNRPEEDLIFTHGDYCMPNIFAGADSITGFLDLGRAGIADKYQDIALCERSIYHNGGGASQVEGFYSSLGIAPDREKVEYYIYLDELF